MKNLANCTPREFLRQTNKIRKAVANWLSLTEISKIRKTLPQIPEDAGDEEKDRLLKEQAARNANKILDIIMDEHPDETLELLALLCFVEPEDVDSHTMSEYLGALSELLNDSEVIGFFISFMKLGQTRI